jgi:hypothetical protein
MGVRMPKINDKGSLEGMDYVFIFAMAFMVVLVMWIIWDSTQPIEYTIQIKSLNDGSQISGHFSLGSGYIKQEPVFVVYEGLNNGGYVLKTLPADDTIIYEDNPPVPYIRVHGTHAQKLYEIHVPSESIIQQYTLDGKL